MFRKRLLSAKFCATIWLHLIILGDSKPSMTFNEFAPCYGSALWQVGPADSAVFIPAACDQWLFMFFNRRLQQPSQAWERHVVADFCFPKGGIVNYTRTISFRLSDSERRTLDELRRHLGVRSVGSVVRALIREKKEALSDEQTSEVAMEA